MSILFLLIPLGLVLLGIAVWAFFWAVSSGQFDDLSTPAWSVVMDDDGKPDVGGRDAGIPAGRSAANTGTRIADDQRRIARDAGADRR